MASNIHKSSGSNNTSLNVILAIVFISLVSIIIIIRIRMLAAPLERDEGEYAYTGQLMLEGVPPYSFAYNMKMPGIYAAYAVILAIFGQTQSGIHFAVLLINTATIILIFLLTKKFFGSIAGAAAGVFFAITSASNMTEATANAENFVVIFALAGIYLLTNFTDSKKTLNLIFGAFLLGIAFMMKQHGAAFILFGLFFVVFKEIRNKPIKLKKLATVISIYSFFAVLPFLITCLILLYCGVFEKFWFWTFEYARHYVSLLPFSDGFSNLKKSLAMIVSPSVLIWLFAFAGLLSVIWNREIRKHGVFIVAFSICSFLAVCPGLYFRPHYFVLFLPALSILAGTGIIAIRELFAHRIKSAVKTDLISILVILVVWLQCFYSHRYYFTESDPELISRYNFGFVPFPESLKIANFIKANSNKDDKIAVFGSEPQIYFYAHRRSATSFIYTYPLMEIQPFALEMQKEMIKQIEDNKPKFMIVVKIPNSWLPLPESEKLIFDWVIEYLPAHYRQVGLVEMASEESGTVYRWDAFAKPSKPEGWIMIFERINQD